MGCDCLQYEALEEDEEEPAACKSTAQLKMDLDENSDEESDQPYITKATNVRPEKSKAKVGPALQRPDRSAAAETDAP